MTPGDYAVIIGIVVGTVAILVEVVVSWRWRRRHQIQELQKARRSEEEEEEQQKARRRGG